MKIKTGDKVTFEFRANGISHEIIKTTRKVKIVNNNYWVMVEGSSICLNLKEIEQVNNKENPAFIRSYITGDYSLIK